MLEFHDDDGPASDFIERRWFAAAAAVEAMEAECETLRQVMLLSEEAFRRARVQLAELTVLRDSFGECLADPTCRMEPIPVRAHIRLSLSAA